MKYTIPVFNHLPIPYPVQRHKIFSHQTKAVPEIYLNLIDDPVLLHTRASFLPVPIVAIQRDIDHFQGYILKKSIFSRYMYKLAPRHPTVYQQIL